MTPEIEVIVSLDLKQYLHCSVLTQKQCEKHGVIICPVTLDQPFYLMASEVVAAAQELDKV